jgi:hypothetical protein
MSGGEVEEARDRDRDFAAVCQAREMQVAVITGQFCNKGLFSGHSFIFLDNKLRFVFLFSRLGEAFLYA